LVLAAALCGACPEQGDAKQATQALADATSIRASEVARQLAARDFATVEAGFAPALQAKLPVTDLAALWESTEQTYGSFVSPGKAVGALDQGLVSYRLPLTFTNGTAELRMTYDKVGPSGQAIDFSIVPGGTP
jgi:hypothetical protein